MYHCLHGPDVWFGWQLLTVWRPWDISDRSLYYTTVWPCVCMQHVDTPNTASVASHHSFQGTPSANAPPSYNPTQRYAFTALCLIKLGDLQRFAGTYTVRLVYITSYCCMMADGSCKIRP